MTYYAGKSGYITIDGVDYPGLKWKRKERCKIIPRNSFLALGKDVNIAGFLGWDLVVEAPYSVDELPIEAGETYDFVFGISDEGFYEFACTARVSDVDVSNDAEDAPNLIISAVSTGDFTPATV